MPFRSEAQRRYMWLKHPEIAKRWTHKYGSKIRKKGKEPSQGAMKAAPALMRLMMRKRKMQTKTKAFGNFNALHPRDRLGKFSTKLGASAGKLGRKIGSGIRRNLTPGRQAALGGAIAGIAQTHGMARSLSGLTSGKQTSLLETLAYMGIAQAGRSISMNASRRVRGDAARAKIFRTMKRSHKIATAAYIGARGARFLYRNRNQIKGLYNVTRAFLRYRNQVRNSRKPWDVSPVTMLGLPAPKEWKAESITMKNYRIRTKALWTRSLHPRDRLGRFAGKVGGAARSVSGIAGSKMRVSLMARGARAYGRSVRQSIRVLKRAPNRAGRGLKRKFNRRTFGQAMFATANNAQFAARMYGRYSSVKSIGTGSTTFKENGHMMSLEEMKKRHKKKAMMSKMMGNNDGAMGMEEKAMPAQAMVFKEADGNYRWVLLSSNGYRDRDGEIISTKALEHDVALWELAGEPKDPLRWWHVNVTDDYQRGIELGHVDFRMVHGHTLVETGQFLTKEIGEAVYKAQDQLAGSIGFRHSSKEPDYDKVFHTVRIFERSLLPRESASNMLTHLIVTD
jgi:hypothetical protein